MVKTLTICLLFIFIATVDVQISNAQDPDWRVAFFPVPKGQYENVLKVLQDSLYIDKQDTVVKVEFMVIFKDTTLDTAKYDDNDYIVFHVKHNNKRTQLAFSVNREFLNAGDVGGEMSNSYRKSLKPKNLLESYHMIQGSIVNLSKIIISEDKKRFIGFSNKNSNIKSDGKVYYVLERGKPDSTKSQIDSGLYNIKYKKYSKLYGVKTNQPDTNHVLMRNINSDGQWAFVVGSIETLNVNIIKRLEELGSDTIIYAFPDSMEIKYAIPMIANGTDTLPGFDSIYVKKGLQDKFKFYRSDTTLSFSADNRIPISVYPLEHQGFDTAFVKKGFAQDSLFRYNAIPPPPSPPPNPLYVLFVVGIPTVIASFLAIKW